MNWAIYDELFEKMSTLENHGGDWGSSVFMDKTVGFWLLLVMMIQEKELAI